MTRRILLLLLLGACSKSAPATDPCRDELAKIGPIVETSLSDGNQYHSAIAPFTSASMCGPEIAGWLRDWDAYLVKAGRPSTVVDPTLATERRDLLRSLGVLANYPLEWQPPKALADAIAAAK